MKCSLRAVLPLFLLLGSCDDTLFGVVTSDLYFDCEDRNPPLTYDRFGKGFLQKQ